MAGRIPGSIHSHERLKQMVRSYPKGFADLTLISIIVALLL
jgi:hypothetical protein